MTAKIGGVSKVEAHSDQILDSLLEVNRSLRREAVELLLSIAALKEDAQPSKPRRLM